MRERYPDRVRMTPFPSAIPVLNSGLAAVMLILGLIMVQDIPGGVFTTSISYRLMAGMMTEQHWAYTFLSVGSFTVISMFYPRRWLLKSAAFLSAVTHMSFALLLIFSNPATLGWAYLVFAYYGYYVMARYWYAA